MPVFEYRALNDAGKVVTGLKEADSSKTLRSLLRKDGVFLTDVVGQLEGARPAAQGTFVGSKDIDFQKMVRGRITTEDIAITTRQLATLLGAGVTLVEALRALVDQAEKDRPTPILPTLTHRHNETPS